MDITTPLSRIERMAAVWTVAHALHGTYYRDLTMANDQTPSNPPVAREIDYDANTGIVTADGVPYHLDIWLAAQVGSGRAHNINEARVQMGLPQDPNLPPSPDGSGNPSFTVPAAAPSTPSAAPNATPIASLPAPPHPSAAPEVHAAWWHGFLTFAKNAALMTGRSFESPAVVAAMPATVQPEAALIGMLVGAFDNQSPATQAK